MTIDQPAGTRRNAANRLVDRQQLDVECVAGKLWSPLLAPGKAELGTVEQALGPAAEAPVALVMVRAGVDHVARFGEVKLARAAIVEQPVGQVDGLLDLDHRQAGTDGMDGLRRIVDEIADL